MRGDSIVALPRLAILGGNTWFPVQGDGVRDYANRLGEAIDATDRFTTELYWRDTSGGWTRQQGGAAGYRSAVPAPWPFLPGCEAVLLQYDMFRFDRRGFAPWLPYRLARLRRTAPNTRIAIMVHELHSPFRGWRWQLKYGWQRLQHLAMRLSMDVLFCAVEPWLDELANRRPKRPVFHLPVGSNLPDRRHARAWERFRLGADDDTLVVASFGTDASVWRRLDYVVHAVNTIAQSGRRVIFLNLGGNTPHLDGIRDDVRVYRPGFLPAQALAEAIAASDLFLAPFTDGVSVRRTTVMAALQHGVAVVGTDGMYTGRLLREARSALRLTPQTNPLCFAREALQLATNREDRMRLGYAARALYCEHFDWGVIATQAINAIQSRPLSENASAHEVRVS